MGFPYGDGLYGKGLYSRRPDWWRLKDCVNDNWDEKTCEQLVVELVPQVATAWDDASCKPRIWASDPDMIPHPEQWRQGVQQAVTREKERIWRRTR